MKIDGTMLIGLLEASRKSGKEDAAIEVVREWVTAAEAEIKRLRDGIKYWSYCTDQGMVATCPEKVDDLVAWFVSMTPPIAPYHVMNTACELVCVADRKETES